MANINEKLQEWLAQGLLSVTQLQAIQQYEANKPRYSKFLLVFSILGILAVSLGVINIIAANWQDIPDQIKLAVDFSLLLLLAGTLYYSYPKNQSLFQTTLLFYLAMVLASIGLLSQIYQLQGKFSEAIFFWAGMTSLLVFFIEQQITLRLWLGILIIAGIAHYFDRNLSQIIVFWGLLGIGGSILANRIQKTQLSKTLYFYGVGLILCCLFFMGTSDISWIKNYDKNFYQLAGINLGVILFFSLAIILSKTLSYKQKFILSLTFLLGYSALIYPVWGQHLIRPAVHFTGFALTTITLAMASLCFIMFNQQGWFNVSIVLIVLHFIRYFMFLLDTLILSGVGLISLGAFILIIVYLSTKNLKLLKKLAEDAVR